MRVIELLIRNPRDEKSLAQAEQIAAADASGRTRLQTIVARANRLLELGDPATAARTIEDGVPPLVQHDYAIVAVYARALNASGAGHDALELLVANILPGSQLDWPEKFPLIPTLVEVAANQAPTGRQAAHDAVALLSRWFAEPAAIIDASQPIEDFNAMVSRWRSLLNAHAKSSERLLDFRRSIALMLPNGFASGADETRGAEAAFSAFVATEPSEAYRDLARSFLASILVRPR